MIVCLCVLRTLQRYLCKLIGAECVQQNTRYLQNKKIRKDETEREFSKTHKDKEILTNKFWSSKNVFKIIAKINLVGQSKVNYLDARVRH